MADFALGLTKTAVEGTLSRVQSAIDEDNKLKAAAQQDLVFITGEFQMMQAFLKKANKERASDEVVKAWVRQLRDLAFDVEDCVEFVVHLKSNSAWSWVWRLLPSFMAPPQTWDVDKAVAELKLLKARVEEVSQRNTRYNLITGDSVSTPTAPTHQLATAGHSTVDILRELWQANMKHCGLRTLKDMIINDVDDLEVISLWGSAGRDIGATNIINNAYCDPEICRKFKARAWLKLMHPFNPDEFLKSLLTQFHASSQQAHQAVHLKSKAAEDGPMKIELTMGLIEQKYLVILQEVPSVVEWEIIRMYLPDNKNGSRIVVSTKHLGVALLCTGNPYRISEFAEGHHLYAIHKGSGRHNVMRDLIGLSRYRCSVCVWGTGDEKLALVKELWTKSKNSVVKSAKEGYTRHIWFDVPHPFSEEDFSPSLLKLDGKTDCEVNITMDPFSRAKFQDLLVGNNSLVVINGLQSTDNLELIFSIFSLYDYSEFYTSIIVVTNDEVLVKICADDKSDVLNVNDMALHPSMQIHEYTNELFRRLQNRGVISVWGAGGETSTLLKEIYVGIKNHWVGFVEVEKFQHYGWVDVPHPFNLEVFYRLLCQSLLPDDGVNNSSISSDGDHTQYGNTEFLKSFHKKICEEKCILIINDLQSTEEWTLIKPTLVSRGMQSRIILIANEESVAKHCVEHLEANTDVCPFWKGSDYDGYGENKVVSHYPFLSTRMEEEKSRTNIGGQTKELSRLRDSFRNGVTSVWGIAGVGKSSLVRYFYNSKIEEGNIHLQRFGWVDVPDPFDLVEFSRRLLLDFHWRDRHALEIVAAGILQGQDPIQGCRQILCQGQCLLVIDGLRSTHDWDLIEAALLSQPTEYSFKIVITNKEDVAKYCVHQEANRMVNVKCLEDDDALHLFKKVATSDQKEWTSAQEELSKLVVAKCGGFPKVLSAISKVSWSLLEHIKDDFMRKLETDPQFQSLRGQLSWMDSYFEACSDLVKPCIFYLSVFTANSRIRRGRLLRRWIAEGYSRDTPGSTAMENAEKLFSELVDLSIIHQSTNKGICHVNSFFREYIISRPMEDNLVFALEGHCNLNSQRSGQHLTIMSGWDRDENVFKCIDFTRLRSLTVFGKWDSFFVSEKMKRLRVLDLEGSQEVSNDALEKILRMLLSLKFISLRGCKDISRLPDTLGGLRQLQSLDARLTSIVTLPVAIIELDKIQCIRVGTIVLADEDWLSATPQEATPVGDRDGSTGTASGQPAVASSPENGMAESQMPTEMSPADRYESGTVQRNKGWPSKLSCSMFPPITRRFCMPERNSQLVNTHNGGVQVPEGIGNMVTLQSLGVVNVNGAGGKAFLEELTKLTQLLKLGLCGINKDNWQLLCSVLSAHGLVGQLESLSLGFDEDCLNEKNVGLPKTLKNLKLYGPIQQLPAWVKDLVNLKKLDLEIAISKQEDIPFILASLPRGDILHRLCIRPAKEVSELNYTSDGGWYAEVPIKSRVLKIDCRYQLKVNFGVQNNYSPEVLIVHCSRGSSFQVIGDFGLNPLCGLKTVWLKGSYEEKDRDHLQKHIEDHPYKSTIAFKLGKQHSS